VQFNISNSNRNLESNSNKNKEIKKSSALNNFIKEKILDKIDSMKQYLTFNPRDEQNFEYIRLVGFLAFFYANRVFADFNINKNILKMYFNGKEKYTQPLKLT